MMVYQCSGGGVLVPSAASSPTSLPRRFSRGCRPQGCASASPLTGRRGGAEVTPTVAAMDTRGGASLADSPSPSPVRRDGAAVRDVRADVAPEEAPRMPTTLVPDRGSTGLTGAVSAAATESSSSTTSSSRVPARFSAVCVDEGEFWVDCGGFCVCCWGAVACVCCPAAFPDTACLHRDGSCFFATARPRSRLIVVSPFFNRFYHVLNLPVTLFSHHLA